MAKTIYKISSYINWQVGSGTFFGGSSNGGRVDLSNYYTKSELQTEGLSIVDFYNIKNAYHNDMLGLEGGSIADNSSGESSGMAGEYYHFDFYNWDRLMFLNFSESLVEDVNHIVTLVNDETSPGILKVYGTDVSGIKGWYDIVEASSGSIVVDQYWEENSSGYLVPVAGDSQDLIFAGLHFDHNVVSEASYITLASYPSDVVVAFTPPAGGFGGSFGVTATNQFWVAAGIISLNGQIYAGGTYNGNISTWPSSPALDLFISAGYDINGGNGNGGNLYLSGGYSGTTLGNIYLSDGSIGSLLAKTSETNVVYYDTTTGLLSYGAGGAGGGVSLSGSTNNTVCTVTGADAIQGEANLTYDGTDLTNSAGDMYADNFMLNSDRRLKTKIKSYKSEELIIDYKQFELKSDIGQQRWGVIAQEIQKMYPELVRENKDGHLSVSYIDLLVREISNLKDRVKELESR